MKAGLKFTTMAAVAALSLGLGLSGAALADGHGDKEKAEKAEKAAEKAEGEAKKEGEKAEEKKSETPGL